MSDEGHDLDGDGATWCGDPTIAGGGPTADCDDQDPKVFNSSAETCDGIDNDCDGTTDEADKGRVVVQGQ